MIKQNPDNSLTSSELNITAGIMDPSYGKLEEALSMQIGAITTNATVLSNYTTAVSNAQISVNEGRPAPVPARVQKLVIDDNGISHYVEFDPPIPIVNPPLVAAANPASNVIAVPSVNEQHLTYVMVQAIYNKTFGK